MKKLFVIALFAAVGMSACSKDGDVTSPEDTKTYVQVTIPEEASAQTRTSIDGNTTNWVQGGRQVGRDHHVLRRRARRLLHPGGGLLSL